MKPESCPRFDRCGASVCPLDPGYGLHLHGETCCYYLLALDKADAPTVLAGVASGSRLLKEEIFGPVLGITTFADEDEAVRLANGTEYGLVSYVFTQDLARGHRMIDRLATGMMGLNTGLVSNAAAPFGGVKQSGIGREGGLEGIHEYLDTKYTLIPVS